jgi:parallel beta-helix repeat protein
MSRRQNVRSVGFKGVLLSALVIVSIIALSIPLLSTSPVHATLTSHATIYISDNSGFTSPDPVNGGGSGTENDPYIIENWVINASSAHGIQISNTTAYFVVRDCVVENGGYSYHGIYLDNVVNGKIENCTCSNNAIGIRLYNSSNNTLTNNTCFHNRFYGIALYYSNNSLISNNTYSNNNGDGILLNSSCNNNLISNNTCSNNYIHGIELTGSSNNTLSNNTLSNNIVDSHSNGIYIHDYSDNNTVFNNTCSNNSANGISLSVSSNNMVTGNTCQGNGWDGIGLDNSSNNTVTSNTCSNNLDGCGIDLYSSSNNTVASNTCTGDNYGIWLDNSSNNNIYHNNIVNNATQAYDNGSNYWDDGYPSGGNYWSDYAGTFSVAMIPPSDMNGDGICDIPYNISGGSNQDNYPLMNPWGLVPGWNLVGLRAVGGNDTPNNIFDNQTYYIWRWSAENKKYVSPSPTAPVEIGVGYWIWVDHNQTLTTSGVPVSTYSENLKNGWNLVSFPVTNENTTPDKLFTGQTYYIWRWDAVNKKYVSPSPYVPVELAVGYQISVGYWIWVDHDQTVNVPL